MALHIIRFEGPPTGVIPPSLGVHWIDTLNKATYTSVGTSSPSDWILQGDTDTSFTNFLSLLDTASSYNAQAGKVPVVNSGESALIFDNESLIDLKDVNTDGLADNMVLFYDVDDSQTWKPQFRMYWRGNWTPANNPYKAHEVVNDQGWTMISNKETSDRAAPQPTSQSAFQLPDNPTWTPGTTSPVAVQGMRFTIEQEIVTLDGWRFWRATDTGDESYTYIIEDITDPANPTLISAGTLPQGPVGWLEIGVSGSFYFQGQVIDIKFGTQVSTGSSAWDHTWTLQDNTGGLPASGTYTRSADFSLLRININADGPVDVKTDLDLLKVGDEILFVEDGQSARFNTYVVSGTPTYSNGDTVLECPVERIANGTEVRTGRLCRADATIKTGVTPASYTSIPNYWFLNPPVPGSVVNGYLTNSYDEVPILNSDAFGIDVRGHAWTDSPDWNVITTVLGGGSLGGGSEGGGSDTFLGLIDVPDTYAGQGGKFVKVGIGETELEFSDTAAPVDSVFGRTGVVVSNMGDYSASQVGADTSAQVDAKDVAAIAGHVAEEDPHTQYLLPSDLPSISIVYYTGVTSTIDGAYLLLSPVTLGNVENSVNADGVTEDVPVLVGQWLFEPLFIDGVLLATSTLITIDYEASQSDTDIRIELGVRRIAGAVYEVVSTQDFSLSEGRSTTTVTLTIPETTLFEDDTGFTRFYVIKKTGLGPARNLEIFQEGSYISRQLTTIQGQSTPGPHAETHEVGGSDQIDHDNVLNAQGFNSHATIDGITTSNMGRIGVNETDIVPLQQNSPPDSGQVDGNFLGITLTGLGTFTITDSGSYNTNGTFRFTQQSTDGSGIGYFGNATIAGLILVSIDLVRSVGTGYAATELVTLDIPDGSENTAAVIQVDTVIEAQVWKVPPGGGAGVDSFNARTGVVVPVSGDYTADEINDAATINKFASQAQLDQISINAIAIIAKPDNFLDLDDTPTEYPADKIGYGVAVNDATDGLEFARGAVGELDGDFAADSGTFKIYADGRAVTLNISAADHVSSSQPTTAAVIQIPFRPEDDLSLLYHMDIDTLYMMKVSASTGELNLEYRDYAGALVAKTNSVIGASMAWLLNVGILVKTTWHVTVTTIGASQDMTIGFAGAAGFTINWGDGEPDTITSSTTATHTYSVAATYTIRMSGVATQVKFDNADAQLALRGVDPIFGIPNMDSAADMFSGCVNISDTIPAGLFDQVPLITTFNSTFLDSEFSGGIPGGLFDLHTLATDFTSTFESMPNITSVIPSVLFNTNVLATSFSRTFNSYAGTDPIPSGLFDNNAAALDFSNVFQGAAFIGAIPNNLFDGNALATDFSFVFAACTGLTGAIPFQLFVNNDAALTFESTFSTSGIAGSIPTGLFDENILVTTFDSTFLSTSISGTIPTDLFDENTLVTTFADTFNGCSSITGLPGTSLFKFNTDVLSFEGTFRGTGLTTVPDTTLFNANVAAVSFADVFSDCTQMVGVLPLLFSNNSLAENFNNSFSNTPLITGIPVAMFDNNALANDFTETFNGGIGIVSELPELWLEYPAAAHFDCFKGCESGTNYLDVPADWGGAQVAMDVEVTVSALQDMTFGVTGNTTITVDWGDGSLEDTFSGTSITHNYTDAGTFIMKINGVAFGVNFNNADAKAAVTAIFPVSGIVGFNTCSDMFRGLDLITEIPSGMFDNVPLVTDFSSAFQGTSGITGAIPTGLFDNNTAVTTFASTFQDSGITTIPTDLFINNTAVTTFQDTFRDSGITSAIPAGLFDTTVLVENFGSTFQDATGITAIPNDLYDNIPDVSALVFTGVHSNNTGVTGLLPELWDDFVNPTSTANAFFGCNLASNFALVPVAWGGTLATVIEVTVTSQPQQMTFDVTNNTSLNINWGDTNLDVSSAASISHTFTSNQTFFISIDGTAEGIDFNNADAKALVTEIFPIAGITGINTCESMYRGLNLVTEIPDGLFDNVPLVTTFSLTFRDTGITAIPAGLFDNNTAVLSFFRTFLGCTGLAGTIPADLFANNTLVTDFNGTFFDASLITTLQSDMFDNNTLVTDFSFLFNGCTGITSAVPELWVSHAAVTHSNTFTGTTSANNYPDIPNDWKGL